MVTMSQRFASLIAAIALACASCHRVEAPPPVAAEASEIAWFNGSLDEAFAAATTQHKLVFLYWGAAWCPPCHDLAAHVFSRRDFQEKLRQFIPVHLDGDAPGAQRAGEAFQVLGYPTVLVLGADRREIARIAGGSDLASYADVLDLALDSERPLADLVAAVQSGQGAALSEADCRRLAWNGWELDPREKPAGLSATLELAAAHCPATAQVERDRLILQAAELAAGDARGTLEKGAAIGTRMDGLLDSINALLADHDRALRAGDALFALGADFFVVARMARPDQVSALRANWFALMDAIEKDQRFGDSTRLDSAAMRLQAAKSLDAKGEVAPEVAAQARATLDAYLARQYDPDTRAGVINSAEWVLTNLDDLARLRTLLEAEIRTSKTPYYYMADLADVAEQQGDKSEALTLLERAYQESTGPATRFQWGALYVAGLLRMSPGDEPRIRAALLEVLGELAGPDRIHARARARLDKMNLALVDWARKTKHAATLQAIAQRWQQICVALPESDPVRGECPGLVGAAHRG
jgi:thiol-disulfide isomerase/thioredoxin